MKNRKRSRTHEGRRLPARTLGLLTLVGLLGLLASPLVGTASAHGGTDSVTIEARDSGCSGSQYCYVVTEGSLANATAGEQVEIVFKNAGSIEHNLHVTTLSQADDANENTAGSAAFANTTNIESGNQTTLQFMVPSGANGLYLWCDVSGHEGLGMYKEVSFGGGGAPADGTDGGQNGSPFPTIPVLLALAGVAIVLRRR